MQRLNTFITDNTELVNKLFHQLSSKPETEKVPEQNNVYLPQPADVLNDLFLIHHFLVLYKEKINQATEDASQSHVSLF